MISKTHFFVSSVKWTNFAIFWNIFQISDITKNRGKEKEKEKEALVCYQFLLFQFCDVDEVIIIHKNI
jgi:hypothetical protein